MSEKWRFHLGFGESQKDYPPMGGRGREGWTASASCPSSSGHCSPWGGGFHGGILIPAHLPSGLFLVFHPIQHLTLGRPGCFWKGVWRAGCTMPAYPDGSSISGSTLRLNSPVCAALPCLPLLGSRNAGAGTQPSLAFVLIFNLW